MASLEWICPRTEDIMGVIGPVFVYVFNVHQEGMGERQKVMIPTGGSGLREVMLYRFLLRGYITKWSSTSYTD